MAAAQPEEKKLLEPTSDRVQVSSRKPASFFVYISKIYLKAFPSIELSALGNAAETSVQVAENLCRHGFAEIEKISSETVQIENRDKKTVDAIRFAVRLKKTKNFDELIGNILK